MNLLALVTDAFGACGGIAQYNRDLMTALGNDDGSDRILVLVRHGHARQSALPPRVRQLGPRGKYGFALAALRAAATKGPFDAVFCGHINLVQLAAMVARVLGVPLWLQVHGSEAWGPLSQAQTLAAERAALVTAVSRYTRRRFLSICRLDPRLVRVLPNTVGENFTPGPKPDYLLDRHGLRGRWVLLTVGRLAAAERGKGHDRVLQALGELVGVNPDLVYLVVGEGDDRARLKNLACKLGIEDAVVFAGMVPPDQLADYYRLADVFVMPSTQEGFGIVFLEAAASGLKVIGGNCDGSIDALADGALGRLIDPTDRGQLVEALQRSLVGSAPDLAPVRRYRFANFARHARDLTAVCLVRPKFGAPASMVGAE
jgi:phosphatidylinositol alpha-1,6-mannosyltransferase